MKNTDFVVLQIHVRNLITNFVAPYRLFSFFMYKILTKHKSCRISVKTNQFSPSALPSIVLVDSTAENHQTSVSVPSLLSLTPFIPNPGPITETWIGIQSCIL